MRDHNALRKGESSRPLFGRNPLKGSTDREDEVGETSTDSVDPEAHGWAALLDFSKAFDEKMLQDWQDELANLLTFTGLLSSVVTGFVALSMIMLQQDTGQRTVDLLAQISQQLSSFNIESTMVNSTLQPSFTTPRFIPSDAVVDINVLWISSLTLSLMAAFWTIAVQQWLRHIPIPRELGLRESIRLRQLRRDGILTWQVPVIVSVLPLVVQVSVLLFLIGLRRLLQELDHLIATVFTVIVAILLFALVVSLPLPLIFPGCPYKSPLLPTLWALFQFTIMPIIYALLSIALRFFAVLFLLGSSLRHLGAIILSWASQGAQATTPSFPHYSLLYYSRVRVWDTYLRHILFLGASPLVFWRLVERWHMRYRKRYSNVMLDRSALSYVPVVVPKSKGGDILPCLQSLCIGDSAPSEDAQIKAATDWVCHDLDIWPSELEGQYPAIFWPGHTEKIDRSALARLRPVLHHALPAAWTSVSNRGKSGTLNQLSGSELGILTLLFSMDRVDTGNPVPPPFDTLSILLRIQTIQFGNKKELAKYKDKPMEQYDYMKKREELVRAMVRREQASLWLPVTLLFRYQDSEIASSDYRDAHSIASLILTALRSECTAASQVSRLATALPSALAAIATTLRAASLRLEGVELPGTPEDPYPQRVPGIIGILDGFSTFLSTSSSIVSSALVMCHMLHSMQLDGNELYLVHQLAISSIVKSLEAFADIKSDAASHLRAVSCTVAAQLSALCSGYQLQAYYDDECQKLDRLAPPC